MFALRYPPCEPSCRLGEETAVQQNGEYFIPATVEAVWQALNDVDVLGACIPGCQEISRVDDTHFDASVKAKIGPVSATFKAALELEDVDPPNSYTIVGNVKGGPAGFGKGQARVALTAQNGGTQLVYDVDGQVGGKLAQVGSRLVDGATRKMADEFFGKFSEALGGDGQSSPAETPQDDVTEQTLGRYESSGQWKIWVIVFGVFVAAMLLAL